MSTVERNKGKLIPLDLEEAKLTLEEAREQMYDIGSTIRVINDKAYEVVWEVEREEECSYFADVSVNEDGSIDFHTLHYNGGGSWEEVVESKVN